MKKKDEIRKQSEGMIHTEVKSAQTLITNCFSWLLSYMYMHTCTHTQLQIENHLGPIVVIIKNYVKI